MLPDTLTGIRLGDFLVLAAGSVAVRFCRQPVRRLRLIALTLAGCVLVPCLSQVPGFPQWSTGWTTQSRAARPESLDVARTAKAPTMSDVAAPPRIASSQVTNSVAARSPRRAATTPRVLRSTILIDAFPIRPAIVLVYASIAAGLFTWWLAGQLILLRLYLDASPASATVVELFRQVAGPPGERVRLLRSDRIKLPFTFTWRRSFIFLPVDFETHHDAATVRFCLAHEWSHIERRDAWVCNLSCLVGLIAFYQPLYWWMRHQLRLYQDYVADARAAEHAPAAEDYAEFLLNVARRRLTRLALPALGIGDRRSSLYQRIAMLLQVREPIERRCGGRWNLAASAAAVVLIVIASGLRLDAGTPPEKRPPSRIPEAAKPAAVLEQPPAQAPMNPDKVYQCRVTDKTTGKPIAGAKVLVRLSLVPGPKARTERALSEVRQTTDAEGTYRFAISPEQLAEPSLCVYLDVECAGYVRMYGSYGYGMIVKDAKLGDRPFFERIELEPGTSIEGRLVTQEGHAAANVKIDAFCAHPPSETNHEFGSFTWTRTDADGRFTIRALPAGNYRVSLVKEGWDPATRTDVEDMEPRHLPGVFGPHKVSIADGKPTEPLLIRAIPHVVIEARHYDSKGKLHRGSEYDIFGQLGGDWWSSRGEPDANGKIVIQAPLGLEKAHLDFSTNADEVLRYRLVNDRPFENNADIELGTLRHDVNGIEIISYVSPVVVVTVVEEDGKKPKSARVIVNYAPGNADARSEYSHKEGAFSDVSFEEQDDGRFRSQQLLPDETFILTATAESFESTSQKLKLHEGATRELTFTLKQKKSATKIE